LAPAASGVAPGPRDEDVLVLLLPRHRLIGDLLAAARYFSKRSGGIERTSPMLSKP
jgi:hypothetical protein